MLHVRTQPPCAADYLVRLGARTYHLARKDLLQADHLGTIFPLPFCPPLMCGLVHTELGPMPLLDLEGTFYTSSPTPTLMLVLQTAKGLLAVAAHAIEDLDAAAAIAAPHPDVCQAVADLTGDFQAAASPVASPTAAPLPARPAHFLKVRSGTKDMLVPATEVQRVGKHSDAQMLEPGKTLHWMVRLEDELLSARSLGALCETEGHGANEPWCLYPVKAGSQALLVQDVLGLVEAPAHHVKTLHYAGRSSTWLLRAQEAPLEVLAMESPTSSTPDLPTPPSEAPAWRVPAQDALTLRAGPWNLVLPAHAVQAVLGRAKDLSLSTTRSAQALPVLDLRRLLAVPGTPHAPVIESAYATQVWIGGRPLLLLSDHAAAAQDPGNSTTGGWHGVPALPQALHALLQAVRLGPGGCELLLQTQNPRAVRRAFAPSRIQTIFVGWTANPAPAARPNNASKA